MPLGEPFDIGPSSYVTLMMLRMPPQISCMLKPAIEAHFCHLHSVFFSLISMVSAECCVVTVTVTAPSYGIHNPRPFEICNPSVPAKTT
jgi:hypothetical protein